MPTVTLSQSPAEITTKAAVCHVAVAQTTVLPAGEENRVKLRQPDNQNSSKAGMIEPKEGFEDQHKVLMARGVATSGEAVPVRIANLSSSVVTLY